MHTTSGRRSNKQQ